MQHIVIIQELFMDTVSTAAVAIQKRTNKRYWIVVMLFIVTSFNYGDRATLSIAGSAMSKEIGLDAIGMGYVFSAFSWAYVIGQIPGGWLLDRFGSKRVYFWSIFIWSLFTLLQGFVDLFSGAGIVISLFILRFLVGLAEAPSFPGNSRIVAAWFPAQERGTAVSIFNSAQYFATVIFAPIMGWLTHAVGWSHVFFFMGGLGIIISFIWLKVIHDPKDYPGINQAELDYMEAGGALINIDVKNEKRAPVKGEKWKQIKQLLSSRMMVGVYLGQYCINALTYFFITWFPVYLVQERGMSILKAGFLASVPAICGFAGGVLGGIISDYLMRKTNSLTFARKTPIVVGMFLSMSMIFCNYIDTEWMVVGVMAFAFFGKGLGALGWAVMADTAPKEISGLSGGLFNTFGNISGIVTPIAIGYIIGTTGSFKGALVYVGIHALIAVCSYLFIVGDIKRIVLKPVN
jgi:ACS family glucarate transporter-like MFS transporter